ncbi:MAG: hypothetical protein HQM14_19695 [SAR324 cluster bacterium]|nr:hypothetical protein [SAR324 cluster bacterium]
MNIPATKVTHQEIEKAMKRFIAKGGKITILPQQKADSTKKVYAHKWSMYESHTTDCF